MAAPKSPPSTISTVKDVMPGLAEPVTQLAFYAGRANGISAAQVAKQIYEERGG
jgi:alkylhydroperoxidase/carboxymuconolactone decarboxylase family protein YurZ